MLKRRFIIQTTVVSFIALAIIIITVNISVYLSIDSALDSVAGILTENRYIFPAEHSGKAYNLPNEVAFTTRYFVTNIGKDGHISELYMDHIHTTDVPTAQNLAAQVIDSGEMSGWIADYKFYRMPNDSGDEILFLNAEERMDLIIIFFKASIAIASGSLLVIFAVSCLLAHRVTLPIAESYTRQKRFITNISHELKTPLAIIRANTEVTMLEHGEDEWSKATVKEVDKLHRMIDKLLTLSKMEENNKDMIKTDFSASDALEETLTPFSTMLAKKGLVLDTSIDGNITYCGDELLIRTLFSIFIDNMIKYAEKDTEVVVTLKKVNSKLVFSTENTTEDVSVGDCSMWFERFYRGDESHNSMVKGHGIGLSQAKAITERHRGKVSAICKDSNKIIMKAEL